jgi:hypothetical protein
MVSKKLPTFTPAVVVQEEAEELVAVQVVPAVAGEAVELVATGVTQVGEAPVVEIPNQQS